MSVSAVGGSPQAAAAGLKDLMASVLAARPAVLTAQESAAATVSATQDAVADHFDAYL